MAQLVIIISKNEEVVFIRILAVDQSTSICGWAVLEKENEKLINKGLMMLKEHDKRLSFFRQTLLLLIDKYKPDMICWEDLKTNRNADTIRTLGEPTGILREVCETLGYSYQEYIPASIKAKICIVKTGKGGRATKADLGLRISELYNLDFPYDEIFTVYSRGKNKGEKKVNEQHPFLNITDAVAIGLFHIRHGKKVS